MTASANSGYSFVNWTENGSPVSSSASYSFTVNASHTLVANFRAGTAAGTCGNPIVISSFPYSDNNTTVGKGSSINGYSCPPATGSEAGPEVVYQFSVPTSGSVTVTVTNGAGVDIDPHLLSACNPSSCLARNDTTFTYAIQPGSYFIVCDSWTNTSGTQFPGAYTMTTTFTPSACYTLSTSTSPGGVGSVSVNTGQNCSGGYSPNSGITLTANTPSGYTFSGWSGSGGGFSNPTANPTTFTITGNASVTAIFTPSGPTCYSLSKGTSPGGVGSVTVNTGQNCTGGYTQNTGISLTANTPSGYTFSGWSGSGGSFSSTASNPTTFTITGTASVTATFTPTSSVYCQYALVVPSNIDLGAGSGAVTFPVTGTPTGCTGGWTAASDASWLTLTGPTSGSSAGSFTIQFSSAQNPGPLRIGHVNFTPAGGATFPLGSVFTVTQFPESFCQFTFSPPSATTGSAAGTGSVPVTGTPTGCKGSWTAASDTSWLTLTGTTSGFPGTWTVPYSYTQNTSSSSQTGHINFTPAGGATFPSGNQFTLTQSGTAAIGTAQHNALVDLYNNTNGASWTNKTNWMVAADECTWYGVACDAGHTTVQTIILGNNNLSGTLPASLGNLTSLQYVDLDTNQLSGSIPPQLGSLTSLQHLNLNVNQLSGGIPPQLGNLTSLHNLLLAGSHLSGSIPPELGSLTSLQYLNLNINQLSGSIPPQLGSLTSLQYLGLNNNNLSGSIPPELGSLTSLQGLSLNGNQLSGSIPPALTNLTSLTPGQTEFRWNALYSTDPALTSFLSAKQAGGDWQSTQTIAPANLSTPGATPGAITVNWTPIAYTADSGFYQVRYSTTSGGPYTPFATTTSSKSSSSLTVTGLAPVTRYYFVVSTTTQPHPNNSNTVTSGFSAEVSGLTAAVSPPVVNAFTANPSTITAGQSSTLSWTTTNATTVSISGVTGTQAANGSVSVSPTATTTYTLTATGSGGTATATATIVVNPAALPIAQHNALVDLYNSTNGAGWTNKTNWMVAPDECTWYGVTCDAGHTTVQTIFVQSNHLGGTLPASLGSLTSLQVLMLGDNQLSGSIPPQLGSLTSLNQLGLHMNQLSGSIPAQLGSLNSLRWLRLDFNQLSGSIPPQLGSLNSLGYLNLGDNQLSGSIPPALTNLTSLTPGSVDIRWNALYSTDPALTSFLSAKQYGGDWQSTQTIAPANLSTSGATPSTITVNWTPITYTADSGFYQVGYSTTAGGPYTPFATTTSSKSSSSLAVTGLATNTKYYFVVSTTTQPNANNANTVTSGFSTEVSGLTGAQSLPPVVNAFTASPSTITTGQSSTLSWTTTNATTVSISGVTGTQAANGSVSVSPTATTTYTLTATGPAGTATATTTVIVESGPPTVTSFTASPATITAGQSSTLSWTTTNTTGPSVSISGVTGTHPPNGSVLVSPTATTTYTLTATGPGGTATAATTITVNSATLPSAQHNALVDLYNSTNGASWTNKTNWIVAADECTWYGVTCDAGHTTVQRIDLHGNNLSGTLTVSLGSLTSLQDLRVHSNHLNGSIPAQLGSLTSLQVLVLSFNQLSGNIPVQLGSLTSLQQLWLDGNQLSGSIPVQLGSLTSLQQLYLDSNQLSGNIPAQLGSLTSLQNLQLGANQLSGSIPPELGSVTGLRSLFLYNNQLSGSIPVQLGNLTSLQYLWLDANQLSGSIPSALTKLTSLQAGTGGSAMDIRWNALYSTDPALTSFLNAKQGGGDWQSTQTIAPANLSTSGATASAITVNWTPIAYTADSGSYQAGYSTTAGGPYTPFATTTSNKSSSSLTVTGLATNTRYYFVVSTTTLPNGNNVNRVTSGFSAEVSGLTGGQSLAPVVTTFAVNPSTITTGQSSTLSWTTTNATTVSISGVTGTQPANGSVSVSPTATTTYTLTATGSGGTATATTTIVVNTVTQPVIVSFAGSPSTITSGQSSTLSWTTTSATTVSISGVTGTQPANGSVSVSPTATTTYTLTATGPSGTRTATTTITVNSIAPPAIVLFAASPSTITVGQSSTLSWTTTNATTVSISGVAGTQPANGSVSVSPTATTTYTLTATGSGTVTATTTIVVNSVTPQPPGSFMLSGGAYCSAGPAPAVLLTWGASSGVATYTLYRNGAPVSGSGTNMPASQLSFDNNANVTAGTSYSYFVRATNTSGYTDSNTISVPVPSNVCGSTQPPTIVFTASPDRLVGGGTTTLSWSVAGATTVSIDNDLGARATSGSVIVNVGRTTQYILTAVGPGGNAFRALTVRVDPALQVTTVITPLVGVAPLTTTLQAIAGGGVPPYISYTWSTGAHGAKATALWTTGGRYGVYCTVVDSRGNQATSPTQVVSVTTPGASATFDTYDPNPSIAGNMTTSTPALLTNAPKATMIAADGVTLLLLRFTSDVPGSVKFAIGGDTCDAATFTRTDDSGLSAWSAEDRFDSITQHTIAVGSHQQAFAVYHAPMNFSRSAADDNLRYRPLTLRAQFTPDSGAVTQLCQLVQITRPPLVLIHGIWSDEYTWTLPLIGDSRFRIQPVSWDGYTSIASNQTIAYYDGVWRALSDARAWGIAVTQVDVIGHSMGGLLARAWAGSASYSRAGNYNKGDYHKLITLNTPHLGSPLATKTIELRNEIGAALVYGCQLSGHRISPCEASMVAGFYFWDLSCGPGAIDDLQTKSPALTNLAIPQVPTHAFVGEAGVLGAGGCLTTLSKFAKILSVFHNLGNVDALSLDTFGETTHDQMVGSVSQSGGLGNNAINVSQTCDSAHTNAVGSSDYSTKIIAVLNKKVPDAAFERINVNQMVQASDGHPITTSSYHAVGTGVSPITVTITSPADGAVVDGGSPLPVQVSASGGTVRTVTLLGDRIVLDKSELPYQFTVDLPEEAFGKLSLFAVAQGTDGSVAFSAPVSVQVRRNTTIDSLQLDGTSRTLLFPGHDQLHVSAMFSDGVLRDVTDPGLGTTYSSGDESIVSVSAAGMMTAKRPGVTVVTVRNGAAEASTFVLVVPTPGARRRAALP